MQVTKSIFPFYSITNRSSRNSNSNSNTVTTAAIVAVSAIAMTDTVCEIEDRRDGSVQVRSVLSASSTAAKVERKEIWDWGITNGNNNAFDGVCGQSASAGWQVICICSSVRQQKIGLH